MLALILDSLSAKEISISRGLPVLRLITPAFPMPYAWVVRMELPLSFKLSVSTEIKPPDPELLVNADAVAPLLRLMELAVRLILPPSPLPEVAVVALT